MTTSKTKPTSSTNKDIFTLCVSHPQYTKNLPSITKENPYLANNEQTKEELRAKMKLFLQVWSGLTKYIKSQCSKGRCVDFPLVGRFIKKVNSDHYLFIPHIDFCESGKF